MSADLKELGQTPVNVVCAGVKSILDIARTLEYLETEGVPVVTLGSENFPAFWSKSSGVQTPIRANKIEEIANMILQHRQLQFNSGILVAVPTDDSQGEQMEEATKRALELAREKGISGAKITPYLLEKVNELTKGASLKANISLVHNNARVAAQIAKKLTEKQPN